MVATFDKLAGPPLRLLTRLGGSSWLDRFELRKPVEQAVTRVAQAVVQMATPKKAARLGAPPPGDLFDLTPTDEQELMIATARRFADDVLRPAAHDADAACAISDAVKTKSGDLGLAPLVIPEAYGGVADSRSLVTSAVTAMELARGDLGLAFALLAPIAAVDALVRYGSAEQQAKHLPRFASEPFVPAALALVEPRVGFDPSRPQTGAVRNGTGWKLFGEKALVPHGRAAELLIVVGEVRGAGARLFLVERGAPGVHVTPEPAMGLRAAATARVRFDGAPCEMLGETIDLEELVARARVLWAALACGAGRAVLDHVKTYVNDRRAFGEPISNRQSVAFAVADIAIELEGMRLMMLRAAALADRESPGFARAAHLAKLQAAQKGMRIGSDGVQLLGGHGYTKEHPVERWYRDLRAIGIMEGAL